MTDAGSDGGTGPTGPDQRGDAGGGGVDADAGGSDAPDPSPSPNPDSNSESNPDSDADADADAGFPPDPERTRLLRAVAEDVRGESSESRQVAAILYRVSDLYDASEDTSPEEIYRNVRHIVRIKERGGLRPEE
jgi:hypothetical protein